jgi:hypothetical protein
MILGVTPHYLLLPMNTDRDSMRIMKSMAETKLRMMWMMMMKKRVIHQCLGNREIKNLSRGD